MPWAGLGQPGGSEETAKFGQHVDSAAWLVHCAGAAVAAAVANGWESTAKGSGGGGRASRFGVGVPGFG